ncbi:hypothetical protein [Alicyclobacillus sp. SO9]|uniref:hypothetical protein n=1 Tax=Alicyclobacillus sp. SO9 TaxID=2665646 RepID=UPI0018E859A9|nr:hypothetical protein [Alicyclobacillus sp. SO9]QQE81532.1 hypothetical protein GI364_24850 [Alicyclobacillus sp. SO9]
MSRSDKKVGVSVHVLNGVYEVVQDVSGHLNGTLGETGRLLALTAANDVPTLNRMAPYFWRSLEHREAVWPGHDDYKDIRHLIAPVGKAVQRLYVRFMPYEIEDIDRIAFALGKQRAHAVAALLTMASKDLRVIQLVAPQFQFRSPYSLKRGSFLWASSPKR